MERDHHLTFPIVPTKIPYLDRISEMSVFATSALEKYNTPPNNYIGSALFLSYIVVALWLTLGIGYSLFRQYASVFHSHQASPLSKFGQNAAGKVEIRNARVRHIKIYTALALISFTSISWHMLGFLITSFLDWKDDLTRNIFVALKDCPVHDLKYWMLETSLFNDFALQLVADGESAVWAQPAILATWGWNLWLASKRRQYGFTAKTMLPFIVLGQNLPVSFAVALFIIQLHLSAPDVIGSKSKTKPTAKPKHRPIASSLLPTIIVNALLLALPSLRAHPGFSYLVLAERILLLLPYTGLLRLSNADIQKSAAASGGFVVANWAMLRKSVGIKNIATTLVWKDQAVKTMSWDAVFSLVVYGVLSWGGGV